ncbi:MAG: ABC transporter ATP-binding protein [Phycisphaerales bacterium]|nr:ABC transporter ATP-binding protein [Phycisphaerales bacterium]
MKLDHVSVNLGGCPILKDISVHAQAGEVTGILGPNAAGKTTLLRTIAGLVKPAEGTLHLDDQNVVTMRAAKRAASIGFVPQRFRGEVPFTVRQIVAMGARHRGPSEARHAVDGALETCELSELASRPFATLSVGQQQRAVIARALAQISSPGVLLLDEPLAALDLRYASTILGIIRQRARQGDTVIVSLHDLGIASASCDQAWLLSDGQLEAAGPPDTVLSEDRLERVYGARFERLQRQDGRDWIIPATA